MTHSTTMRMVHRWISLIHVWIYRWSRGRLGARLRGVDMLLLTTRGRRSGRLFTRPLLYLESDGAWYIVASFAGSDRDPDWWLNLRATPEATIEVGPHRVRIRAEQVAHEDQAALWPRFVAVWPGYADYQRKTTRPIPIIRLSPTPPDIHPPPRAGAQAGGSGAQAGGSGQDGA